MNMKTRGNDFGVGASKHTRHLSTDGQKGMKWMFRSRLFRTRSVVFALAVMLAGVSSLPVGAQDWVRTGTNLGVQHIRLAVADFKPGTTDPQTFNLKGIFDQTLYSDLSNAGVFDMVSKSMSPPVMPGSPQEIQLNQWSSAPANAQMVVFGSFGVAGGQISVQGYLFDAKNQQTPQVLGKQFTDTATGENARQIAHRFADEIILRLTGITGIAETKIYYVVGHGMHSEIWVMDYDGEDAHAVTHLGTASLSPRVSPDNSKLAFASFGKYGWQIRIYSLKTHRYVSFHEPDGTALSPAWAPNGQQMAYSLSANGNPDIYTCNANGTNLRRVTAFLGPNVSPVWNPKTGAQIAWVSGMTKLPQIYVMDSDGSNVSRMTDGGYATSPSWSPNGQFLSFAWDRSYGPGAPGGEDIYIMDIASRRWEQLTHGQGVNDFPSWSPDGRHIVFQRKNGNRTDIWTMLADGSHQQQLTHNGDSSMPNWSWK